MATLTGTVATGADDFDELSSTNTTINPEWIGVVPVNRKGYALITMDLSGGTLTAATIYWCHQGYTKSKTETYDRYIQTSANGSGGTYDTMYSSTATPPAAGTWENTVTFTGSKLAYYNTTGGTTAIRFGVNDGTGANSRSWDIRAYEYSPFGIDAPYIVLEYEPYTPPTTRRQRIFVM